MTDKLASVEAAVDTERLQQEAEYLLYELGEGVSDMDSVAYDTAWVSRLASRFPEYGFEAALPWVRDHQYDDGSWGGEIIHYHDRIISTLASIITLREQGDDPEDERQIKKGEAYLWREYGRLLHDANDTGGFPIVILSLINEASQLGLDVPHDTYRDVEKIEKKLDLIASNPQMWRYTTIALSLEAIRSHITSDSDVVEPNGSVGVSPAATAATLITLGTRNERSLDYLWRTMNLQGDGGTSFASPFDVYETAWVLDQYRLSGMISPDHPRIRYLMDFLSRVWSPDRGIGFSSEFSVTDLDDTAVTMSVLDWGGYSVRADVFAAYERDNHFQCWPGETDISLSVHIRTLAALQNHRDHPQYETWSRKITSLLRTRSNNGFYWFDKWHISPYYLSSATVWLLNRVMDDLLMPRIKWIQKTQRSDGGWGYYGRSTPEETAYCLQALIAWDRGLGRIDPTSAEAAARYLGKHLDDSNHPPLWIGKCVYLPRRIVRAAILSALYSYSLYKNHGGNHIANQSQNWPPLGSFIKIKNIGSIMASTRYHLASEEMDTEMSHVSVNWDNDEKTVIRYIFAKDYSWSDFRKAIDEASKMLDAIDHKADVIMDLTSASLLPSGAITQGKWLFANTPHPNIGQTVIVGANTLIQAIVDASRRLSRQRAENWKLLFANSLDDARKLLPQTNLKGPETTREQTEPVDSKGKEEGHSQVQ